MTYLVKLLGSRIAHISNNEVTLCGVNLSDTQYEHTNIFPDDKSFACKECESIKKEIQLVFDLEERKEIKSVQDGLKMYANMRILFDMANEEQRLIYALEEALTYSSTYLVDSLENPETKYTASVNENKIQLTYPVNNEFFNPEVEFSKLEYFSVVMKQRAFQSLNLRRN